MVMEGIPFFLALFLLLGVHLRNIHAADEVGSLIEDFWQWRIEESPEYAIKYAVDVDFSRVEEFTEDAFTRRINKADAFLRRISALDLSSLASADQDSVSVMKALLDSFKSGYKYRKYGAYNSVSIRDNFITSEWKRWATSARMTKQEHFDQMIRRYAKMPENTDQQIELMRLAIAEKTTLPMLILKNVNATLANEIVAYDKSDFYVPFTRMPDTISAANQSALRQRARQAIENYIIPSVRKLKSFMEREYFPNARPQPGASSMAGGLDFYKECLRWHLSLDLSPEEVHQIGLREVARIQALMEKFKEDDGFQGSLQEYFEHLKSNPDNFFPTEDAMLQGYKDIINNAHGKLGAVLKKVPKLGLSVTKIESPQGPTGYYQDPPLDGSGNGVFKANVNDPTTRPKFDMYALALHEAEPGHHTQAAYAIEEGLPNFRRGIEFRKYYAVPFNWLFFTGYSEGWALYAEYLGREMGAYDSNKYAIFGKYSGEVFRAGRLVVDTGLHAFGWSPEKAKEYLLNITTLPESQIDYEIKRYIAIPGQACAYKIGDVEFRRIRKETEAALGSNFDVKEFHHQILSLGNVPLKMLDKHIKEWVQTVQREVNAGSSVTSSAIIQLLLASVLTFKIHIFTSL